MINSITSTTNSNRISFMKCTTQSVNNNNLQISNKNIDIYTNSAVKKRHVVVLSRHFQQNLQNYRVTSKCKIENEGSRGLAKDDETETTANIIFSNKRPRKSNEMNDFIKQHLPNFHLQNINDGSSGLGYQSDDENMTLSQHFEKVNTNLSKIIISSQNDKHNLKIPCLYNFTPRWLPPRSPHALIEEEFGYNPWGLLVATIFLSKTQGTAAKPVIWQFLNDYPSPNDVVRTDPTELEHYFKKLGLVKRADMIWKMSKEFLETKWRRVGELHGVGQYGEDAYRIFCLGDTSFTPCDRYLRLYLDWLNADKYGDDD